MRRFALIVFAFGLMTASPLLAAEESQEKDDLCAALDRLSERQRRLYEGRINKDRVCRDAYWSTFEARPASELLDAENFQAYDEAIERQNCETASALLAKAFVAAYPRAPDILTGDDQRNQFWAWRMNVVEAHYPELDLCLLMQDIREAQAEIERRGLKVGRYHYGIADWSFSRLSVPPPVRKRETAITVLLGRDHATAMLALLRLSEEGKLIRLVPEYRYFLLQRLLKMGVARAELADMLAATEARLQPAQMEDLKRQAQAGRYTSLEPKMEK